MLVTLGQIALGGALGSVSRYLTGLAAARAFGTVMPWGTLAVNVAGSFVIGLLAVSLLGPREVPAWAPLVVTGFLGGFTTFSAFSLDVLRLAEAGRGGAALAYVALSLGLSLGAVWAGWMIARGWA